MSGSRFESALPGAARHGRDEFVEVFGSELDDPFLFGAHVSSHQELGYFESVVEALFRLLALREALREVTVFRLLAVLTCFITHKGHQTLLGILLFYEVFAGFPLDLPAHEESCS